MTQRGIDLLGAGGHASVVADVAHRAGLTAITVWYESAPNESRFPAGTKFANGARLPAQTPVVLAIGGLAQRRAWRERFLIKGPPLVDPSAVVGHGVAIGPGVVIMPGVIINPNARIGDDAILNTGCIVEHDCHVGTNTHVSPGAHLGGSARIGADVLVGTGAIILPGIAVGDGAIIGAGAVVTQNVVEYVTVVGIPARVIST